MPRRIRLSDRQHGHSISTMSIGTLFNHGVGLPSHPCSVSKWTWFFAIAWLAACSGESRQSATAGSPPTLTLAFVVHLDSTNAVIQSPMAVSATGLLALASPVGDTALIGVYDSTGSLVAAFGRRGSGPGELQAVSALVFDGSDALVAGNAMETRLLTFTLSGKVIHQVSGVMFMRPAHAEDDSLTLVGLSSTGKPQVVSTSLASGESAMLVDFKDSALSEAFLKPWEHAARPMDRPIPTLGANDRAVAVGDAAHYRIWLYDRRGQLLGELARDLAAPHLSPRRVDRQLASLRSGPLKLDAVRLSRLQSKLESQDGPYFDRLRGLGIDGDNRIWVGGIDGDSAFADVFGEGQFLGRIGIGCKDFEGNWAVDGDYVALLCVDNEQDGTVEARVYRIVPSMIADGST